MAPLVIASNRGPLSFSVGAGRELETRRGAGGLVAILGPAVAGTGATWVAAAITDADRIAAERGVIEAEGFRWRSLAIDPDEYRMFYDVVANGTLWFLHHQLWDLPRRPRFDRRWREAWDAFRSVNRQFAEAIAEEAGEGTPVLVHDYQLALAGALLAEKRPDLRTVHFSHIPFCTPEMLRVLPDDVSRELLEGMAANRACGFHTRRWAAAFEACCDAVLGYTPPTFVSQPAPDADDVLVTAESDACGRELAWLEEQVGDRRLIVRVDRVELSKNILRGFHAFEELLDTRPEWRERVTFAAIIYPSRQSLAEYLGYRQELETLVRRINDRWATGSWTPIVLDVTDNYPRSVAGLRRYDVLLVNPVMDGLNLIALEGPLVNERDGVLVLSREAGIAERIGALALAVNPFDVSDTAEQLHAALSMPADERKMHASALREAARVRTPADWLADQLAAATPLP